VQGEYRQQGFESIFFVTLACGSLLQGRGGGGISSSASVEFDFFLLPLRCFFFDSSGGEKYVAAVRLRAGRASEVKT